MIPARGGALIGPRHKHFRTLAQDDGKSRQLVIDQGS